MRTKTLRQEVVAAVLCAVTLCGAFPTQIYKQATSPGAFIGEGINNIAVALLQDTEQQGNAAFSPLGHSAILAALAEGASGQTRAQLLAALKLPQDSSLTRATYRSVLGRMKEKNAVSKPEFRSWFYVYKKSAQVEESYTNMLRDNFLMEVRDIESVEIDTPTEFFTKKEQEVESGQKLEESKPVEDNASAVPVTEVQVSPDTEDQKKDPPTVSVPEQTSAPVTGDESSKDKETEVPSTDQGLPAQSEPLKESSSQQEAVPTALPMSDAEETKDPPPAPVSDDQAVKNSVKDDEESKVPPVLEEEAPVAANSDKPKHEQEEIKTPASEDATPVVDTPKDTKTEVTPAQPALEQNANPVKAADEVVPEKDTPPAEAAVAPSPAAVDDVKPDEPPAPSEDEAPAAVPTTDKPTSEAAEPIKEAISEQPSKEEATPVKEAVVPSTELLPPMESIQKDEDVAKGEPAPASPVKETQPDIAKETMVTTPGLMQENLPSDPTNELHKDEIEETPEKISLAKFSKQGLPKDEKKPTSVTKPDKRKDEKKKASRNAAEAESDGRHPASGPSLLTAFNALYYKGTWQTPFDAKFKDDFYVGEGVKKEVTVLRTQGEFRIGEIKELDARAIELPYKGEGGRYSLLVLLPRAQDGLANMTEALSRFSFRQLSKYMRQKHVDVTMPEFEIDCISHPQNMFRKLGVSAMLEKDNAEFPGISKTQRLYLQDDAMAQLVRFRLDDDTAIANYLSTMSMSTRSGNQVFQVNHPFIFYLRDNLDNLTIVVGRVIDPSVRPDFSALQEE